MDRQREIRELAYRLYEQSGRKNGNDISHWLEAERIVSAAPQEKTTASAGRKRASALRGRTGKGTA